jgi:hypothetical protein
MTENVLTLAFKLADLSADDRWKVDENLQTILRNRHNQSAQNVANAQGGRFRCTSRDAMSDVNFPYNDHWRTEPNGDRCCSYCGSLHFDDAIAIMTVYAEAGDGRFSTSDKRYKYYMNRKGVQNAAQGGIKFYTWHLPGDERSTETFRLWAEKCRSRLFGIEDGA